jgi:hypothetical protein
MSHERAVSGMFMFRSEAEDTIQSLKEAEYSMSDVSILFGPTSTTDHPAPGDPTKAAEGTEAGLIAGGTFGGVIGLLAGIGSLAIPGVGTLIAAGPIIGAIAGLGAGGVVGGLAGALIGLGIPEENSNEYEGRIRRGGILLSVRVQDVKEEQEVGDILQENGADEIAARDNWDERGAVVDGSTTRPGL